VGSMKTEISFLQNKEVKKILELINKQWNAQLDWVKDYAFLLSTKDNLYIINREVDNIDFTKLNINAIGLYFAELKNGEIRLSIEGSQLVGPFATKNVVEISDDEIKLWFKGNDLNKECDCSGFVLLTNKDIFVGCGRYSQGIIYNFVPKARRLIEIVE